jgi:hypothetical protein
MSETPKTDAATEYMDVGSTGALAYVRVYFAEQLERENADLLRALKDLREQVDAHVRICGVSHFNTRR